MTKKYFDTNSDDDVVIVVDSVDIVMFLLYTYCMFVEGGIMRNKYRGGIIKFSEGKRLVDLFIDNSPVIK